VIEEKLDADFEAAYNCLGIRGAPPGDSATSSDPPS
jgi:hypothetical protein